MPDDARLAVRRTPKLYIGGAFPRSESGRTDAVTGADGEVLAHVARASRKDLREAVTAAHKAWPGWRARTGYNRGQICYRVAELLEGRSEQLVEEVRAAEGVRKKAAGEQVAAAIDRWVWYAGWTDKLAQVDGAANPVAGPYFNFSVPEPTGVVGVVAPQSSSLLGLTSLVAPAIVPGNVAVVLASSTRPLPAVTLSEVLVAADVPGGVVNLLTGRLGELAPVLAGHLDVHALDLTGLAGTDVDAAGLAVEAAESVKRVRTPPREEPDWRATPSPRVMLEFTETKTVWHPVGV